jgi:hypothetical protein
VAYVVPNDFRTATLAEYCQGLPLTTSDVDDTKLTATIARVSLDFDDLTKDHFESASLTFDLSGDGSSMLTLPQRCTAVTTVKTLDFNGVLTTQAATVYRLVSSLNAAGSARTAEDAEDYLQVIPGQYLTLVGWSGYGWPRGPKAVQVAGTFGWTVTPAKVKRAVALMVYDQVKPMAPQLRKATQWSGPDITYTNDPTIPGPTGMPDVDRIIRDFTRTAGVLVG